VKKRVAVEAGRGLLWHKFVGMDGLLITLEEFGKSAPGDVLMDYFGFSPEKDCKEDQGMAVDKEKAKARYKAFSGGNRRRPR
jgi:transketolase